MITIDGDDFGYYFVTEDYSENTEVWHGVAVWNGPKTPETEIARIAGIKKSWDNDPERKRKLSVRMSAPKSPEWKALMSAKMMGNTNGRKNK